MTDMTSRYRAAWESARRRARQLRDDRDEYQRIAAYCQQSLRRDGVPTDIDVEDEVRDAIAEVGIEWDTPHGETPADLVDAIVGRIRPALATATEQRNRYRAAWESARARARRYRAAEAFAARYTDRHVPPTDAALADQLAEHREAIAYALRHTLAAWADATGHAEGAAAGSLHRALSWVTGHPTPPRDIPHEVTTRVEAHLEHLTRRLEETVRRVDDVETVVHHTDGDTPQNRIASQVEIAETLTTAGLGPTVARQIAYLLQQRFEIRQRPAEDGES